jgi:hypothetical protein
MVNYATANGTAASGSDYTAASGTLIFNPGETSKTINVPITDDSIVEGNETFTVTLSSPVNATLGTTTMHTYSIIDDVEAPVINLLDNPGFENGSATWTEYSSGGYAIVSEAPGEALNGNWLAGMGGAKSLSEYLYQDVKIPADATEALLDFWYNIDTAESPTLMHDSLKIQILRPADNVLLANVDVLSNLDMTGGWVQSQQYDLMAFRGQQIRLKFKAKNDSLNPTTFSLDDLSLTVTRKINLDSPNGEEIIPAGSTYDIQLRKAPEISTVKLKYTLNNGMTWKTIEPGIAGTSYSWPVPKLSKAKTKCKIKVLGYDAYGNKVGQDDSDETFTISP